MSEIVVESTPTETVIEISDGPALSTIINESVEVVVSGPEEPLIVDLNSGPRGEPGSSLLNGPFPPPLEEGSVGDIYLVSEGVTGIGDIYRKTLTNWEEAGNIRGPAGGIASVNGKLGPEVDLTKNDIDLAMVDNTADTEKPVSTLQQAALDLKANDADVVKLAGAQTITGAKTFSLAPVVPDNSFAISKVSGLQTAINTAGDHTSLVTLTTAQSITGIKTFTVAPVVPDASFGIIKVNGLQAALDLKAPLASPTFTGTVAGITKTMVGLANVDNTSDASKPVSTAQAAAIALKVSLTGAETIAGVKTFSSSPIVPTPTTGTQASTKQYVDDQITLLTTGAPALLNTLDELAAALGDDANFATTVTNNIATKEPLIAAGTTAQYRRGDKTWQTLNATAVGLGNVSNVAQVDLTTAQTIAGIKTFSSAPVVPDNSWTIAKTNGLQTALNAKEATITAGTTAQYWRGDKAWITLNTVTVDLTTAQTIAGIKTFSSSPVVPDASFTIAKTTGLQTALDAKATLASAPTFTGAVTAASFSGSGASLTSLPAGQLTGTVLQARLAVNVLRFEHGSNASAARPTGATYVDWIGSVQPTNMIAGDTWINTSTNGNVADLQPAGTMVVTASAKTSPPSTWYYPEGQQILISGDTALYNELTNNASVFPYGANTNGAGAAGSTHFRLPDMRGKVVVHVDGTTEFSSMGVTGGVKTVTLTLAQIPNATGNVQAHSSFSGFWAPTGVFSGSPLSGTYDAPEADSTSATSIANLTFSLGGGGGSHPNLQPFMTLRYLIKR